MAKTLQETWAENEAARKNQETRPMTHREKITAWVISVVVVVVLAAAIIWPRVVAWDSARLETARLAGHEAGKAEGFQLGLAAISIVRVTDAGDPSYNGLYYQAGVYAEKPAYTNGDKWLFFEGSPPGTWALGEEIGEGGKFRSSLTSTELPSNPWNGGVRVEINSTPSSGPEVIKVAGDPSYNGLYYQAGVYAGKPAYTNGDKWLYWVYGPDPELQFGWWFLSSFKGGGETWYRSEVVSPGVLPDNLWSTNSLPTTILKVKKISGNQISAESK